jgi:hypothetical protein
VVGISVKVIWFDEDLVEILFRCSNDFLSGEANIYLEHNALADFANRLNGFPANVGDSRDITLGAQSSAEAKGGVQLHFSVLDSVGHSALDVKLRRDDCKAYGEIESVALRIPIDAAGVDSFVKQLRIVADSKEGDAHLQSAR